ncbi:MAG: helix-turn-helix domain-containing protein [Azoarcus sp.]|nr:helix-turn-helix domain-containing protein [Azoarcus sp.]
MHKEEIKAAMRMKGVTPTMLADRIGVSSSAMCQTIDGAIKSPRIQAAISEVLGLPPEKIWPHMVRLRRSKAEISADRGGRNAVSER